MAIDRISKQHQNKNLRSFTMSSLSYTHTHAHKASLAMASWVLITHSSSLLPTSLVIHAQHNLLLHTNLRKTSFLTSRIVHASSNPKISTASQFCISKLASGCLHGRTQAAAASENVSTLTASGQEVPRVSFNDGSSTKFAPILNGCWTLAGGHGRVVESEILDVMEVYARNGLTSFDTADIYGPSERILGVFRERWEEKKMKKEEDGDVQVFTKHCPNIFRNRPTPQFVEQAIKQSLTTLRMPKLDLVQLHWWDYEVPGMVDVAKSLADLREQGLITSIGTTNMSTEALAQIVDAGVPIVCNQVQFSLLDQRPRNAMLKYCTDRNIKLFTYGTLAGGLLSNRYLEEGRKNLFGKVSYTTPDLNTSSLNMYWRILQEAGGEQYWRRLLSTLGEIASSRGVSIAAVALRWAMDQGPVHPIVGLRNAKHLEDNLMALTFSLESTEMNKIDEVLATSPGPRGDCYQMERGL